MENDSIPQLQIKVEKLLCKALGREWAPSGFSIVTLCEDVERLREAAEDVYSPWSCGEPLDHEMQDLGRALGFKIDPA